MHNRRLPVPALIFFGILLPVVTIIPAWVQDNYEIQVYGSGLVAPGVALKLHG
jgi:hypothetical protein